MKKVKIACVQMRCVSDRTQNIKKAEKFIEEAAQNGANIVLLPELFERPYFCQERNYGYYKFAEETEKNAAVKALLPLSEKYKMVIPVSFTKKAATFCITRLPCLKTAKFWAYTAKRISPTTIIIRKNFISRRGIRALKPLKRLSAQ